MMIPPIVSAFGRFFFESFSSALIEVAIIQPSYANAAAQTDASRGFDGIFSGATCAPEVKFCVSVPVEIPYIMPTTAISPIGMSLITVVDV